MAAVDTTVAATVTTTVMMMRSMPPMRRRTALPALSESAFDDVGAASSLITFCCVLSAALTL